MSSVKMNISEKKYLIKRATDILADLKLKKRNEIFGKDSSSYPTAITAAEILNSLKSGELKPLSNESFIKQYEKVVDGKIYFDTSSFVDGYDILIKKRNAEFDIKRNKLDKFITTINKKFQNIEDQIMLGTSKDYALNLLADLEKE